MNSTLVGNQGLLARLLVKIRGLEKARLCEVVDGLSEPPNFLKGFSTISSGLMDCLDGPLPVDSFAAHPGAADGPGKSNKTYLALKESFCPVALMVSEIENWTNQPGRWIQFTGFVGG
jgi:hypothetical protein